MSKFADLTPRIFSAIAGGFIIILALMWNEWSYFLTFLAISGLTIREFYRLVRVQSDVPIRFLGVFVGMLLFVLSFLVEDGSIPPKYYMIIFPLASFVFLIKLYKKNDAHPFVNTALFYLGLVYVAVPFSLINILVFHGGTYSYEILLGMLFLTWANDIGAYFTGVVFGKTKLFERISPKKSWEGSIGGATLGILVSFIVSRSFNELNVVEWVSVAAIVVIAGTYGDLVESHFKRSMKIKDSGSSIPGHGGFLDRFDSLLLAVPFVVVFLKLF